MSFSLSLKTKSKGKKKRTANIFNLEDKDEKSKNHNDQKGDVKRQKIRISEINSVDEVKKQEKDKYKLIIKADIHNDKNTEVKEMTSIEEYEAVPIELFGEAMLRGMGWDGKDGLETQKEGTSTKYLHPEGRGIGAKSNFTTDTESFMPILKVKKENHKSNTDKE